MLANDHLTPVPRQSGLSANDKGENEMKLWAVYIYLGIYLSPEENLGKLLLEDPLMTVQLAIAST